MLRLKLSSMARILTGRSFQQLAAKDLFSSGCGPDKRDWSIAGAEGSSWWSVYREQLCQIWRCAAIQAFKSGILYLHLCCSQCRPCVMWYPEPVSSRVLHTLKLLLQQFLGIAHEYADYPGGDKGMNQALACILTRKELFVCCADTCRLFDILWQHAVQVSCAHRRWHPSFELIWLVGYYSRWKSG